MTTQPAPTTEARSEANEHAYYQALGATCSHCGHPIEPIDLMEHMELLPGMVVKYACRAGTKDGNSKLKDYKKMAWYANRAVTLEERRLAKDAR